LNLKIGDRVYDVDEPEKGVGTVVTISQDLWFLRFLEHPTHEYRSFSVGYSEENVEQFLVSEELFLSPLFQALM
jgi:hypothetical protein